MKISVLCVTHERPKFMPWMLWNYERMNWDDKELVIVDSSEKKMPTKLRKGITYIHAVGANVPEKRNIAIESASGDYITWLDDDDWRHPNSLNELSGLVGTYALVAGERCASFVSIRTFATSRFVARRSILFASMLVETNVAKEFAFDESIERGSDVDWLYRLTFAYSYRFTYDTQSMFLCHDVNLGNKESIRQFNRPISDFKDSVSKKAWGDTEKKLMELIERIYGN